MCVCACEKENTLSIMLRVEEQVTATLSSFGDEDNELSYLEGIICW